MPTRVLVVDDDPKILSLLRRGLSFAGYAVDTAVDGEAALAAARDRPPDVVVLDVMLPGVDGLEVCRRLRLGDAVPPDPDAHRQGPHPRSGRRPGRRRRRLPGQAIRFR